jgi:tetratricopeptide (TPR) repeat protein
MPRIVSGRIPALCEMFVPRQETGLSSAVSVPLGATVVLVPAEGRVGAIGGTGKTQMAAAVTRELYRDHGVELVVWVAAASLDAVLCSYAQALRDVGGRAATQSAEQAASRFVAWLAVADRPWVVVLDDLREGAVPDGLWPSGPAGRVLVTSSHPDAAAGAASRRIVPVGPFSPREAMSYLSAHLQTDTALRTGALELTRDLGFWPLALGQAAAVMTANGIGCREYHSRLSEYQLRRADSGGAGDLRDLVPTWSLAVRTADRPSPAGLASRALSLVSLLAPHGIPGVVLTSPAACEYLTGRPGGPAERALAAQAVHNLARSGLLSVDDQSAASTILVHPAVQSLARQHLPAAERRGLVLAAADALLQAWSLPQVPEAVVQRLRDCTASLHRLAGQLLWDGGCHPVLIQAGRSLRNEGADGRSVDYWQSLLAVSEPALGPGHAHTVLIREELGAACEASGRPQDAIAMYERVLSEQERTSAGDQAQTGVARVALARAYHAVGRDADAIRLAQGALAEVGDQPGSVPDQLIAQETLARAYLAAGQVSEAVAGFRQVLASRERARGPDHPMTTTARGELAAACQAAGQRKEALALFQRALADCERLHGPGHLDTLAARASLASAYLAASKPKQAIPLYQRTLAGRERLQGPDHADTVSTSGDLAAAYLAAGQLGRAVSQYEAALAACQRVFGPGHQLTRAASSSLNAAVARGMAERGIDLRSRIA